MATYEIIFTNNSSQYVDACVYQQIPDLQVVGVQAVAWMVAPVYPTSVAGFSWSDTYDFVWRAEEGSESNTIATWQVWPADITSSNQVTLTYAQDAFTFENQTQGPEPDILYLIQDGTVPAGYGYAGIGMSDLPTFAASTEPNITLNFPADIEYYVTFGTYNEGQLLSMPLSGASVQVTFPANVYSMSVTLNSDNTLSVSDTTS